MLAKKRRAIVCGVVVLTAAVGVVGGIALGGEDNAESSVGGVADGSPKQAGTTKLDFFRGGSQPDGRYGTLLSSSNCGVCHGSDDPTILVNKSWAGSMHALSARDALWLACLTATEQDAPFVGDMCIRCHVPRAWLMGRSTPTDGSSINRSDRDSISCHFCHRMVDPFYKEGVSPEIDEIILAAVVELPVSNGSASFVLDPADRRRGKRERSDSNPHTHFASPFFEDSAHCETCHDVSGPALDRQPDGTYVGNTLDEVHPTGNKYDMFPLERTSSEWAASEYAKVGVDAGGRFGGSKRIVSTCQDCHMPDTASKSATEGDVRPDMADHGMYGGGTWMPLVVANLYPDEVDHEAIQAGIDGSRSMLRRAATMELTQLGDSVNVRVINETGHKLPTGQAEGRQMWLNVKFFDDGGSLLAERGHYDEVTAVPFTDDTAKYELVLGVDEAMAAAVGLPVGPTHHIAFCNTIYEDSRIPPRGFTNAAYEWIQSPVVGVTYRDGEYWDDALFMMPTATARVEATLFYKTVSSELVLFLRHVNYTNDTGEVLYQQWLATGKSPPEAMVSASHDSASFSIGDFNDNSATDSGDTADFMGCVNGPQSGPVGSECAPGDLDSDDDVDLHDVARWMKRFGS